MKPATNRFRVVVERLGVVALLEHAGAHDRHPVAHGHGLDLVVGDVERGHAHPALDAADLGAHLHAQLGVEVGERLVHQEHARLAHDGPAHGNALPLAARELAGLAIDPLGKPQQLGRLVDLRLISALGSLAQLSAKPMFSATVMCGYRA